jgi:hypothetical protein
MKTLTKKNKFELLKEIRESKSQWIGIKKEFKAKLVSPLVMISIFILGVSLSLVRSKRLSKGKKQTYAKENNFFLWWMAGLIVEEVFKRLLKR